MSHIPAYATRARQGGATLVMALLILVLIMMIGIAALSTSNTQFKLAGNLQFEDSATNNAEAAILAAEAWLALDTPANYKNPGFSTYAQTTTPQLQPLTATPDPFGMLWQDTAEDVAFGQNVANSARVAGNVAQRYFIQLMSRGNQLPGSGIGAPRQSAGCNKVDTFLITARGTSARGATKYIQSYYAHTGC